ncbi:MAG: histidine kinase, partial [Comamonadaceae bacterium]
YVLGCNSLARQLLPLPLCPPGSLRHCSDLMALPWPLLFDAARARGRTPAPLDLPLWSGLRLSGLAQRPDQPAPSSAWPQGSAAPPLIATAPAPLREAETALIRRAVQDARGNVAEAARALGISRATVYRKLGAPKGH